MKHTLKVTNVLSDPTRFHIYHYVTNKGDEVTVCEVAEEFNIHPNVARLHLTKLTDVNMLVSETKKSGKGGRPGKFYRLSEELVQLTFPYRDYHLLSKITLQALMSLGDAGIQALYATGKEFGKTLMQQEIAYYGYAKETLTFEQKFSILKNAAKSAGIQSVFHTDENNDIISFELCNCPFKECATEHPGNVCQMHISLLRGIFEALFDTVSLIEGDNMIKGCKSCTYKAFISQV
ncbi:helix-turn-helix transcriptional regulator [Priestia taiwanensis]|uniref:Transcriptional regulator n=1 Tax=Priestia taiwanensis TaxID=1347902 RepID=A0A917AUT3_9BACI|nr:helix-turn-helix domain-containing protein [Priestia taiwanensis]MBM7363808.1 putative ArsR family transcriptional regulator [Priestia taiwanensis]GGE73939.1 transcriptional regulator [Priestia taiwanensis]